MFTLAVFIGIYSYALAGLGWAGWLTWGWIWGVTAAFFGGWCLVWRTKLHLYSLRLVRGTTLFAFREHALCVGFSFEITTLFAGDGQFGGGAGAGAGI